MRSSDSVANTWSFDKRATITGGYGTTPITTAAFSTVGAGVIALFAGHNYYNDTYTANFGSDTYVDKTKKSTGTPAYVNAYYGYRINTAAQTGTTVQTNLLNGGAAAGDAYLGLQALSFTSTPSGGGGTTATVTSAGGIASAQAFGTAVLNNRAFITGTGIASAQVFGSHTVSRLTTTTLTPTGIASAQAFGVATVSNRRSISGTGIASAEAFGVALVSSGSNKTVIASGIASGESFGTATLTFRKTLSMTGIASGSAFGTALVSSDLVAVAFTGVGSSGVGGSGVSNTSVQLASSQGLVQYFTL